MDFDLTKYVPVDLLNGEDDIETKRLEVKDNILNIEKKRKGVIDEIEKIKKNLKTLKEEKENIEHKISKLGEKNKNLNVKIEDILNNVNKSEKNNSKLKLDLERLKNKKQEIEQDRKEQPKKYLKAVSQGFFQYLKHMNNVIIKFEEEQKLFECIYKDKELVKKDNELSKYIDVYETMKGIDKELSTLAREKILIKAKYCFNDLPEKNLLLPLYYKQEKKHVTLFFPVVRNLDYRLPCLLFYNLVGFLHSIQVLPFEEDENDDFSMKTHLINSDDLENKLFEIDLGYERSIQFIFEKVDDDLARSFS